MPETESSSRFQRSTRTRPLRSAMAPQVAEPSTWPSTPEETSKPICPTDKCHSPTSTGRTKAMVVASKESISAASPIRTRILVCQCDGGRRSMRAAIRCTASTFASASTDDAVAPALRDETDILPSASQVHCLAVLTMKAP